MAKRYTNRVQFNVWLSPEWAEYMRELCEKTGRKQGPTMDRVIRFFKENHPNPEMDLI